MIRKIAEAFVEFFGSLLGVRSVIDRPLHDSGAGRLRGVYGDADKYVECERASWEATDADEQPHQRRRRPRMPDEEHERLMNEADRFGAGDDVSQDEINDLL